MRIRRLDLTRFGHFSGLSIDFGEASPGRSDFHLVYGPNEAGKTTLMEGYLRLLYGFPYRSEDYAFRHSQDSLQVGGLVECPGPQELVRIKKRGASLLDARGQPLPETVLQSALGGLTVEAYRNLLCLDDKSIEDGGEEILKSEGDIGALLFSAAAGLSGLTRVLTRAQEGADAFWRKGARKHEMGELQHRLKEISSAIRDNDISASRYAQMRAELDRLEREEAQARERLVLLRARQRRLAALKDGHALRARMAETEERLAPLRVYPARIPVDAARVEALSREHAVLSARLEDAERTVTALEEKLAQASVSDVLRLRDEMAALSEQHSRAVTAGLDLPKREAEQEQIRQSAAAILADIGQVGRNPADFVLPAHRLETLEALAKRIEASGAALAKAGEEEEETLHALSQAEAALAQTTASLEGAADTAPVLEAHDAAALIEEFRRSREIVAAAERLARDRLADIQIEGASFRGLPAPPLEPPEAEAHARAWAEAVSDRKTAVQREEEASDALARSRARAEALAARSGVADDAHALASRQKRDLLWQEHRKALDHDSAGAFEAAMREDDAIGRLRLAEADHLARLRETELALSQAQVELERATAQRENAERRCEELASRHEERLTALGLPQGFPPDRLATWLVGVAAARRAGRELVEARNAAKPVAEAADKLRAALAPLSGMHAEDSVETVWRRAQSLAQQREKLAHAASVQAQEVAREKARLERRQTERRRSEAELTAEREEASRELARVFADGPPPLREAVSSLRTLRETGEKMREIEHRIASMRKDRDAFADATKRLLAGLDGYAAFQPLEAWRLLSAEIDAAGRAQTARAAIEADLDRVRSTAAEARLGLDAIGRQVGELATHFAPGIEVATVAELGQALSSSLAADALRDRIAECATDLDRALAAGGIGEGAAALAETTEAQTAADLAEAEAELEEAAAALEAAIAGKARAIEALRRVQGESDIAELGAERRAIEARMEQGSLDWLRDRLGLMLAERALRRYRDAHRSEMLKEAEAAFRTLTNGAYERLTTQPSGTGETLLAISTRDGAAKLATQMSKGTRFQLYLALRAAAYSQMASQGTVLPFFCDDIFETFDEERTTAACGLMRRIGEQGQAIYLTHHAHVVEIARSTCPDAVTVHELRPGSLT